jgi:hypothetical protein
MLQVAAAPAYNRALMRAYNHRAIRGTMLLLFASAAALGDGAVRITITNDNPETILATVYDMNAQPRAAIVAGQRINGFASISISISAGPDGYGHLSWTATTTDSFFHKCGSRDRSGLEDDTVVHVYAKSECRSPQVH